MDPLSITAGVIGILDFSGKVVVACSTYISALKDAPKELFLIRAEVSSLQAIVRTLDLPPGPGPTSPGNADSLRALRAPNGTLALCQKSLQGLLALLVPRDAEPSATVPQVGHAKKPSRLSKFGAFRLSSLLSSKKNKQARPLYEELGWDALDLATWPYKQRKANALLKDISQHKATITLALEADSRQTLWLVCQELSQINPSPKDPKAAFLDCIKAPDTAKKHSSVIAGRYPGTCSWIFAHESYEKWLTQGGMLWMNGIAGYGKSTLVSSIIQQLQLILPAQSKLLVYFYFDRDDKEMSTTHAFLHAAIAQLVQQVDLDNNELASLCGTATGAGGETLHPPTFDALQSIFLETARNFNIFVVLDALDECDDVEGLFGLVGQLRQTSVNILLSSRPSASISTSWKQLRGDNPSKIHEIALSSTMNKQDIERYVTQTVESMISNEILVLGNPGLKQKIIGTLNRQSDGMFQWAAMQLRCLLTHHTDHDISKALKELPRGLDRTYRYMLGQLMSSLEWHNLKLCQRMFRMLTFAHRPLTLPELSVAMSIQPGSTHLDKSSVLTSPQAILSLGGPLVVFNPETNLVQFSHHTIREYIQSAGHEALFPGTSQEDCHREISRICLTYIQLSDVVEQLSKTSKSDLRPGEKYDGTLAFMDYATGYWIRHAQQISVGDRGHLSEDIYKLFFLNHWIFSIWQAAVEPQWQQLDQPSLGARRKPHPIQHLYASGPVHAGTLAGTVVSFKREPISAPLPPHHLRGSPSGAKSGASTDTNVPSLHAFHYLAMLNESTCLYRALNDPSEWGLAGRLTDMIGGPLSTTALHIAAKLGAVEFLDVCVHHPRSNVDINAADSIGCTALFYASQSGCVKAVDLLLSKGANACQADWYGSGPLHEAVRCGHADVVSSLLSSQWRSIANITDKAGDAPLTIACRQNRSDLVSVLTRHSSGGTVLLAAQTCARVDKTSVVSKTLATSCSKVSWNASKAPLQELIRNGIPGVVRMSPKDVIAICETLLENGYPIDLKDADGNTALTYAASCLQDYVADYLFRRGARWSDALRNLSDDDKAELILAALNIGGFRIALGLLKGGTHWDPETFMASWTRGVAISKPGTAAGSRRSKRFTNSMTSPQAASPSKDTTTPAIYVLREAIRQGMDIHSLNANGKPLLNLLWETITENGAGVPEFRWILDHGGDPTLPDSQGMTVMDRLCEKVLDGKAASEDHQVFVLLLSHESTRKTINDLVTPQGTLLHTMVHHCFSTHSTQSDLEPFARSILDAGASISIRNSKGETPLATALAALPHDLPKRWHDNQAHRSSKLWVESQSFDLLDFADSKLTSKDRKENDLPDETGDGIVKALVEIADACGEDYRLKVVSIVGKLHFTERLRDVALRGIMGSERLRFEMYDFGEEIREAENGLG